MTENSHQLNSAAVDDLEARFRGDVLRPGDDGYDDVRTVWNAMIDRRPTLVVRPADAEDVIGAVGFAREHDLLIGVRGGGHNVAGNAVPDGGLMIDCSSMTSVRVDPESKVAWTEPGVTVGEFDRATQAYGLATPGGIVSETGIAGLTLGGGWGWLSRSYGLTIDNLRSVDVVTVGGEMRHASERENADLFWGIRGGGGNFGIVTSFEFDLHEIGSTMLAGVLVYPFDVAGDLLRFHRDVTATAPDELCCYASVRIAPSASFVPREIQGEPVATVYLCYAGAIEDGEQAIRPLREFETPIVDLVEPRPYTEFQALFDNVYPSGYRNYWKSGFVDRAGLSDDAIDTLFEYASTLTSPYTSIVIEHLGGAISAVDPEATAYAHRDAGYSFNVFARWQEAADDDRHIAWAREFFTAMVPFLADGVYVNFLSREGDDRVRAAFGENYDRLVDLKNRYDPENTFRMNQNVAPT